MAASTQLALLRDINNFLTMSNVGRPFSQYNQYFTLTEGTVTTVTVPAMSGQNFIAFFRYTEGADVFVLPAGSPTLSVPTGTVTSTLAQFLPDARLVASGQTLQFLYANANSGITTVSVGIEYYQVPSDSVAGY